MCCNPANGRVDFEDGWLIKSSFLTKDEHETCHLTRTKVKKVLMLDFFFNLFDLEVFYFGLKLEKMSLGNQPQLFNLIFVE